MRKRISIFAVLITALVSCASPNAANPGVSGSSQAPSQSPAKAAEGVPANGELRECPDLGAAFDGWCLRNGEVVRQKTGDNNKLIIN